MPYFLIYERPLSIEVGVVQIDWLLRPCKIALIAVVWLTISAVVLSSSCCGALHT